MPSVSVKNTVVQTGSDLFTARRHSSSDYETLKPEVTSPLRFIKLFSVTLRRSSLTWVHFSHDTSKFRVARRPFSQDEPPRVWITNWAPKRKLKVCYGLVEQT